MLPARALFYAVVISLLVALMSGAMLLASYHQHLLLGQLDTKNRLVRNCQSGIELLLGVSKDSIPKMQLDLFGEEKDSVVLLQKKWGLLEVAFVKSWAGFGSYKDSVCRSFVIGRKPNAYALKLAESNSPLAVCGRTKIIGDAFVPREGIERGLINGKPYQNDRLVYGKMETIKGTTFGALKNRFAYIRALEQSISTVEEEVDSIVQSFGQKTKILRAIDWYTDNMQIKGNVVLIATNSITVAAGSILEDVILIAPEIYIESGFEGALQAFAQDSLEVGEGVLLDYPSVLSLLPPQEKLDYSPRLTVKEGVIIRGALVVPSFLYQEYEAVATLEFGAQLMGQVWVNGNFQLKGEVIGSVLCQKFFLQTAASIYENYLLDAVINRSALPDDFLMPTELGQTSPKAILKEIE